MIRALRETRVGWPAFIAVAVCATIATVLIIRAAQASSGIRALARAELHRLELVRATAQVAAGSSAASSRSASSTASTGGGASGNGGRPTGTGSTATGNTGNTGNTGTSGSAAAGAGAPTPPSTGPAAPATATAPKVRQVFEIALSTPSFKAAFGAGSPARYLHSLVHKGTLLAGYRSIGSGELADYIAMLSGQAPNRDTRALCTVYADFPAGAKASRGGQVRGAGCVYPNTVLTLADQVSSSGHTWRAYIAGMGASSCVHPNAGAAADSPLDGAGPQYDPIHNPFIYFHSLLDLGGCQANDVSLTHLRHDLARAGRTATLSFISPGACADAGAGTCPDGSPAGLAAQDAFLAQWVPRILHSPGYRHGGVLVIAFAGSRNERAATGALIISRHARAGRELHTSYGPYALLASIEAMLGYRPLGHAKAAPSFAARVLDR